MRTTNLFVALFALALTGCQSKKFISPTSSISVEEAYTMTQKGVLLLDVREPEEVAELAYKVKNYRNVPLSQLESRLKEIPQDQQIIVACRSGSRSRRACETLSAHGFQNMTNMEGGMLSWEAKGLPVVRGQ